MAKCVINLTNVNFPSFGVKNLKVYASANGVTKSVASNVVQYTYGPTITFTLSGGSYWTSLTATNTDTSTTIADLSARDTVRTSIVTVLPNTNISVRVNMPNQMMQIWTVNGVSETIYSEETVTKTFTITANTTISVDVI